jgi:3-phenylpropionate/trans-cinnamate dioxygenase ferredoxin reductase subunit
MADERTFAIVGAGAAGAKAAETLRDSGFEGRVVVIGADPDRPYARPPLSKVYLRGELERDKIFLRSEEYYAEREIELRTGTEVVELDAAAHELVLGSGEHLRYDRVLLATGGEPRRLSLPGAELDGVLYLRAARDADRIRERLAGAQHVVVVGGGWIGGEVAASARRLGLDVTILDRAALPLEAILGPELGRFYLDLHAREGVEYVGGAVLERIEGNGSVTGVRLADGRTIECDALVAGIGVVPRVSLAERAGLALDNGVVVDEHLRTSDPDVFAAGDIARAFHPFYGEPLRVEHWFTASRMGPVAGRSMLGEDAVYDDLPYFYSDQYDASMKYVGRSAGPVDVFRGDPASGEFMAFWLDGGRVSAALAMNLVGEDELAPLVRSRALVDPARLADPDTPLAELAGEPNAV